MSSRKITCPKLQVCERCKRCLYNPEEYCQCRLCFNKYMKTCKCKQNKYDSFLYKCCYECSKKLFKTQERTINIDALELLPEDN